MNESRYTPGVCNIGPDEIRRRRWSGWLGVGATLAGLGLLIWLDAAPAWRLALVMPATGAAIGFLQAHYHFCAAYGWQGIYNVLKPAGQTESVILADSRAKDRAKAQRILRESLVIGVVVALVATII